MATSNAGSGTSSLVGTIAAYVFVVTARAPAITSADATTFTVGSVASFTVTATGNPSPTMTATGALPTGVSFAAGVLSGTPAAGSAGSYPLSVTAANGVAPNATQAFTLTVAPAPQTPAFTAGTPPATARVGASYSYTYAATGVPAPTFVLGSGALPVGLSLDATTGVLSGTPAAPGPVGFTVYATNGVAPYAAGPSTTITVRPVPPADFDGSGSTDVSVYRPSMGAWYVLGGTNAFWGITDDVPVPGDYNGDGRTDLAVYRPSTGAWYVLGGTNAFWGTAGDYNGDGRTDMAVFRPFDGAWYVQGQGGAAWGTTDDVPLPISAAIRTALF